MPSRPLIALILLFWLGVAGWFVVREVAPNWGVDTAPPFHIDLTDEVGRPSIDWDVFQDGKDIGDILTKVRRIDANTFEMSASFGSTQLQIFLLEIRKVVIQYFVSPEGSLLEASIEMKARAGFDIDLAVKGKVEDGIWKPAYFLAGEPVPISGIEGFKLPPGGSILNTMLPLNRIPGLSVGRRWTVPMIDPVGDVKGWIGKDVAVHELHAEVLADTLVWNKEEIPCFKIEYREPGRSPVKARTWVRRIDGIVLQQEAYHDQMNLVMVRKPSNLFE